MDFNSILQTLNYMFNEMPLIQIKNTVITFNHISIAMLSVLVSIAFSHFFRRWLKQRLLKRFILDTGLEYALLQFLHYAILGGGIYIGLNILNLELGAFGSLRVDGFEIRKEMVFFGERQVDHFASQILRMRPHDWITGDCHQGDIAGIDER